MNKLSKKSIALVVACLSLAFGAGCSKQEDSSKAEAPKQQPATASAEVSNNATTSAAVSTAPAHKYDSPAVVNNVSSLRPKTALDAQAYPVEMAKAETTDRRSGRAYPMQPPVIPHKIDGYQIDQNVNQCMSCHGRTKTEKSGAIMVSVTHFMNRDYQVLSEISPRRYFCTQCHVEQKTPSNLIENEFLEAHQVSSASDGGSQ